MQPLNARYQKCAFQMLIGATTILATEILARPSLAQSASITFSGAILENGPYIDTYGYFGPAGKDLAGAPFLVKISYIAADFTLNSSGFYQSSVFGAITESITINNVTKTISEGQPLDAVIVPNNGAPGQNTYAVSDNNSSVVRMVVTATSSAFSLSDPIPISSISNVYFIVGGSNYIELDGVADPPQIYLNGSNTPLPPPPATKGVVAGQQISLTVQPVGSGQNPAWSVGGRTVGGYTAIPCGDSGLPVCGPGAVTPTDFTNPVTTMFYWVTPGNPKVTYWYTTINGYQTFVEADFHVVGPKSTDVKVDVSQVNPVDEGVLQPYVLLLGGLNPSTPGIKFSIDSGTVPENIPGYFQWVQIVVDDTVKPSNGKITKVCSYSKMNALDNTYPYGLGLEAEDSPYVPILSTGIISPTTTEEWNFAARMYLMWNPGDTQGIPAPNTIMIPLGYIPWSFSAQATKNASNGWSVSTTASSPVFEASPAFPMWRNVDANFSAPNCTKN